MTLKNLVKKALLVSVGILLLMPCAAVYAQEAFPPGGKLPSFNLRMPNSPDISAYLRMKDTKSFSSSQIPAKLIIVEFFSVFCPICQANTSAMNRLYHAVRTDQALDKDIKVISVALIGKTNEIAFFKEKFNVEYPLFEDPKGEIQSQTKVKFVPLTLVIDKNGKIVMSHPGLLNDLDAFLIELRKNYRAL